MSCYKNDPDTDEVIISMKIIDDDDLGVVIETSLQKIRLAVDNFAQCCEDYGFEIYDKVLKLEKDYVEEEPGEYGFGEVCFLKHVGSKLIAINWASDEVYKKVKWKTTECAIVTVETDNDIFHVCLYNERSEYYPHTYSVNWGDFRDSDTFE